MLGEGNATSPVTGIPLPATEDVAPPTCRDPYADLAVGEHRRSHGK